MSFVLLLLLLLLLLCYLAVSGTAEADQKANCLIGRLECELQSACCINSSSCSLFTCARVQYAVAFIDIDTLRFNNRMLNRCPCRISSVDVVGNGAVLSPILASICFLLHRYNM